jgi:hypothetical protein
MLFGPSNPPDQADNVCFQCHQTDASVQVGGVTNRDYSRTFGGASGGPASIFESFGKSSYHNLNDVLNTARANWPLTFTADSNPCSVCHNAHIARRNKINANKGDPTKSAISKPSAHEQLWGDDTGERLIDYISFYQAPLSDPNAYEPDGSYGEPEEGFGSNMPDYVTFCQECHADAVTSTTLGRNLRAIDWDSTGGELGGDKHGHNIATSYNQWYLEQPYATSWTEEDGIALSCMDCHEPHGSPRVTLIRRRVNGDTVENIGSFLTINWKNLCQRCHGASTYSFHHRYNGHTDAPYALSSDKCDECHASIGYNIHCTLCHFHGGNDSWLLDNPDIQNGDDHYTGRRTF